MLKMLILPVLLLAFVACETATSNVGENRVESGKTADLELVDWNWSRTEYGSRTLAGAVKNNTSKRFDYVSIQFNLFNGADEQVGSTLANVNNLDGGATWRFEALVLQDDAVSARVSDLNGF